MALTADNFAFMIVKLGSWASVTAREGKISPPRHLILHVPLVFPGVRVSMVFNEDYSMYLIWALILKENFYVYLTGLIDSDCGLFRSPSLDTMMLTTEI